MGQRGALMGQLAMEGGDRTGHKYHRCTHVQHQARHSRCSVIAQSLDGLFFSPFMG